MTRLLVNTSDIAANAQRFVSRIAVPIIGVVKGNGYGLGLWEFARCLLTNGVDSLAVDDLTEALCLREKGFEGPLLLLKPLSCKHDASLAFANKLQPLIGNPHALALWAGMAEGEPLPAHLYLDTGFGGYGFRYENIGEYLDLLCDDRITWAGCCTHFAASFGAQKGVETQFNRFTQCISAITARGITIGKIHCCNSHAALRFPHMHGGAVRCGSVFAGRAGSGFSPIGTLETTVLAVYPLKKGAPLGYASAAKMPRDGLLGVLDCGYGQGLGLTKKPDDFRVLGRIRAAKNAFTAKPLQGVINGHKAQVLGRINMNHTCILCPESARPGDIITFPCQPLFVPRDVERSYT
ncbi:MAG: alanine racemase [Clostridia bacterium]|nr:alanine racemase [Clostridia bacterium]